MIARAKLFLNGASQAVRLPKEFRFKVDEVCVTRVGEAVVLFPEHGAWDLLRSALGDVDDDFMESRDQPEQQQQRPSI